ncbi:hypothetical protein [Longispora urticae]
MLAPFGVGEVDNDQLEGTLRGEGDFPDRANGRAWTILNALNLDDAVHIDGTDR